MNKETAWWQKACSDFTSEAMKLASNQIESVLKGTHASAI